VGSNNYSQYDDTSSGSETVPLNPTAPARGAAVPKLEHQTLLDIDNPEQNANSFGKPFESSVSKPCTLSNTIIIIYNVRQWWFLVTYWGHVFPQCSYVDIWFGQSKRQQFITEFLPVFIILVLEYGECVEGRRSLAFFKTF